ncbi:hypothetical protein [Geothrix campi]|uniref:hypothetical protein n=1 Tax=Geothrix campi TaxID=2966450 RepID=UPI002147FB0E|nr:hypothetical protein [Geothrix sp. SG10]
MREGFWIHGKTGSYRLVDEHARWIQRPENARGFGISEEVAQALSLLTWNFNGRGRRDILLLAMDQGLIRTRGHGPGAVTFEATLTIEETIKGSAKFMQLNCGPATRCTVSDLRRGETIVFTYGDAKPVIEAGDYRFLLPVWMRPTQVLPLPRPFVLLDGWLASGTWTCSALPGDVPPEQLVAILRAAGVEASGWLALKDGRTWKLSPSAPPLTPVDPDRLPKHVRVCSDCGWPTTGQSAPCQCGNTLHCRACGLPRFWPVPGKDMVTLDGESLHVPLVAGYGHGSICLHWPSVQVVPLDVVLGQGKCC